MGHSYEMKVSTDCKMAGSILQEACWWITIQPILSFIFKKYDYAAEAQQHVLSQHNRQNKIKLLKVYFKFNYLYF